MRARSLVRGHLLEDRTADDGVCELERVLLAEQIGPNKGAGGRHCRARVDAGECGGEGQLRAIAENGRRTQQIGRLDLETSEARRDAMRDCSWTELEDVRRMLGGRCETL